MKTRLIRTPMRLLLMLLAVIVTPLTASANGTKIGELCYILDDANLTAEVTYENENIDEPRYTSLPSDLTIPETVDYAEKTYSVTSIGSQAFFNCSGLKSIDLPDALTSIDSQAFQCCTGLTSVDILERVTIIGTWAFYGCSGMNSVTISSSVTQLGAYAFGDCDNLTTVTCNALTPPTGESSVFSNPKNATLFVPASALDVYNRTAPWYEFGTIKAIGDTPTGVSDVKDMCGIIVSSSAGVVTVKGLDPSEVISWYDLNGVTFGVATATDGVAVFSAAPGSIVILHTDNSKSLVKVAVK